MTIRKGEAWGTVGAVPAGAVEVTSDLELGRLVRRHREAGTALPPVVVLGGDLMRAVGGSGDRGRLAGDVAVLPVDVVRVETEGQTSWFVAHLVARRGWWRGELAAAVNGQFVGRWDLAARAHPNDGRVDVVRVAGSMRVRDRWTARSRAVTGGHVPHPAITVRQHEGVTLEFERPLHLWLDGERWRTARTVALTVEPDALVVCV